MKNEPLFGLVKSLNQTEKTYFRKHAKRFSSGSLNYIRLFELIEKQNTYDEGILKIEVGKKHFSQYKKHLYEKLKEALRAYHSSGSIQAQVRNFICDFEILKAKGLNVAARKSLVKAKKIAIKNQLLPELVTLGKYEAILIKEEDNLQQLSQHFDNYQKTALQVSNQIKQTIDIEELHMAIVKWNKKIEWVRNEVEKNELMEIIDSPKLKIKLENYEAESQRLYINAIGYYFLGDFEDSLNYFKEQREIVEFIDDFNVVRCFANNALLSLFTKNDSFVSEYNCLQIFKSSSKNATEYQSILLVLLKLIELVQRQEFEIACSLIRTKQQEIEKLKNIVDTKNIMYNEFTLMSFYSVAAYLGNRKPKQALQRINYFLNNAQKDLKQDTYGIARILNLCIHMELGNWDLLEYEYEATSSHLKSKNRINLFEKATLEFVKAMNNAAAYKQKLSAIKKYKEDLVKLTQVKFENVVFSFFDFKKWAERFEIIISTK